MPFDAPVITTTLFFICRSLRLKHREHREHRGHREKLSCVVRGYGHP
jgi:hypothetical protein